MADERVERRLAAILAADVAGYSRLMGEDEAETRADHLQATVRKAVQQGEREDVGRRAMFQRVWELAHAACGRTRRRAPIIVPCRRFRDQEDKGEFFQVCGF